jgi:hypothetical protein
MNLRTSRIIIFNIFFGKSESEQEARYNLNACGVRCKLEACAPVGTLRPERDEYLSAKVDF